MNRWRLMVDTLRARALPPLPAIPGRVHRARDEPIAPELLEGITDPRELGLVLGIGTKAAAVRLSNGERTPA